MTSSGCVISALLYMILLIRANTLPRNKMSIKVVPYISKQKGSLGRLIVGTLLIDVRGLVCQQTDTRDLFWMLVTEKVGTRCHKTDIVLLCFYFLPLINSSLLRNPTFAVIKSCLRSNSRAVYG